MKSATSTSRANQPSDRRVAEVAWMYYVKAMNQVEIAAKLSLSRPTVISYIKLAKERNLVDIRISPEHFRLNELSSRLRDKFELDSAYIVPDDTLSATALTETVCEAAAHILPSSLEPGDELGVSWGTTIALVAEAAPRWPIENLTVRQLIGSMANPLMNTSESCTMEIARRFSAKCVNLNAPAVCSTSELAETLRQEPIIAEQLAKLSACNKAIYSLSPCSLDAHVVQFKVATRDDIAEYKRKGAVGMIAGRFFDTHGAPVVSELDNRLLGAEHEALCAMDGHLVVSGLAKAKATLAALRGGFVNRITIDTELAEGVLSASSQD